MDGTENGADDDGTDADDDADDVDGVDDGAADADGADDGAATEFRFGCRTSRTRPAGSSSHLFSCMYRTFSLIAQL